MIPILQSTSLMPTVKKDLEEEVPPKPLNHLISFDPNSKDVNDNKVFKGLFDGLNRTIEKDRGSNVLFDQPSGDKTSDYTIDLTKPSPELDKYNSIKKLIEGKANRNTNWKNTVAKTDRDRLINSYADQIYGLSSHIKDNLPDGLSDTSTKEIQDNMAIYLSSLNKGIQANTNAQFKDYEQASWGIGKAFKESGGDFVGGVSAKAREFNLRVGLNTEFNEDSDAVNSLQEWQKNIYEDANKMQSATGIYALPLADILRDENTDKVDVLKGVLVKAFQSFPSQISSLIGMGAALSPVGRAYKLVGIGTSILGSNIQETGGSSRDYQEELGYIFSQAKSLRSKIGTDITQEDFDKNFKVKFGDFSKPIDEYSSDEIRQMADSYANQYANFSSVVELASLGIASKLGNVSRGYSGWLKQGKPFVKTSVGIMTKYALPVTGVATEEAIEEMLQGTISEAFKWKNLPNREFEFLSDEVLEGGAVGFTMGLFMGGGNVIANNFRNNPIGEMSLQTQEDIKQYKTETKKESGSVKKIDDQFIPDGSYDDAIIFGQFVDTRNFVQDIAKVWNVPEEEVQARFGALMTSNNVSKSQTDAKKILLKNPEIAQIFPATQEENYKYIWDDKPKPKSFDVSKEKKPRTKKEIDKISKDNNLSELETRGMIESFDVDPVMPEDSFFDEGNINSIDNDFNNYGDDISIITYELDQLKVEKERLTKETSAINAPAREGKIKEIDKKIKDYTNQLRGGSRAIEKKTQKKIEKNVEAKKKKKDANIAKNAINVNKRVQFPSAKSKKDQRVIVDGKFYKLTKSELNTLENILNQQRQGGSTGASAGQVNLRMLALEVEKRINKSTGNKKTSIQTPKDIDVEKTVTEKEKFESSDEFKNAPTLDLGSIISPKQKIAQGQSKKPPIDKEKVKTSLKNANGEAYKETKKTAPKDIKLFSLEDKSLPNVYAKSKNLTRKINKIYDKLWAETKEIFNLSDNHFEWWIENIQPLANQTSMAHEFDRWSSEWMHQRPLLGKLKSYASGLTGREALNNPEELENFLYMSEKQLEAISDIDAIKDSMLTVKEQSKIANSFWAKYEFNIDPVLFKQVQQQAYKILNDKELEGNAFDEFVKVLSKKKILTTLDGQTVGELLQRDPRAREAFKRYWTMMLPENLGTTHQGTSGNTIHFEAKYSRFADPDKKQLYFPVFRPTTPEETSFAKIARPETETQKMINRHNFNNHEIYYLYKKNIITNERTKDNPYGAFNAQEIETLKREQLVPKGISLISTRGEKSTYIMVKIPEVIKNQAKNDALFEEYLVYQYNLYKDDNSISKKQLKIVGNFLNAIGSPSTMSEQETLSIATTYKKDYYKHRADWITRHEFLTDVLGKEYIFDSNEKIAKRIKIPFTPVFTSPTLPDRKKMYFDSKGASIELINNATNEVVLSNDLTQTLDGEKQYIRDGAVFTSQSVFTKDYPEHFGNHDKAVRIKTIHYANDGDGNIEASKHDEKTITFPYEMSQEDLSARIKDSNGNVIAILKKDLNGDVNIYHPSNTEEGQHIDYLSTDDETKIRRGSLTKNNVVHTISGNSIGIIQYSDDKIKEESMLTSQSSYFIQDQDSSDFLIQRFRKDQSSPSSPVRMIDKLIKGQRSGADVDKLVLSMATQYYDAVPGNVQEMAKLGAGKFPSNLAYLKEVLKNKFLKKIADNKTAGSYLDFRPDDWNQVTQEEIVMPVTNSLLGAILKSMGKRNSDFISDNDRLSSVNDWLSKNKKYVLVARSPLTGLDGLGLYYIKNLDPTIGDSFIIHPKEVKERHQGDQDNDHGHVVLLEDSEVKDFRKLTTSINPMGLSKYARTEQEVNNSELSQVPVVSANMTYGETAIGEIVNIMRYSSLFNKIFKDGGIPFLMTSEEDSLVLDKKVTIKIRKLDDFIKDPLVMTKDGGSFSGKFSEYLRIHLQSALDHPKELLLNEWDYSSKRLSKKMFYNPVDPSGEISDRIYETINKILIQKILKINSFVDNMVDPQRGQLKFDQIFNYSKDYSDFMTDRAGYIIQAQHDYAKKVGRKGKLHKYYNKHAIIDKDNLSVEADNLPVDLSEQITTVFFEILENQGLDIGEFYNIDPNDSLRVHTSAIKNLTGRNNENMLSLFSEEEASELSNRQKQQSAKKYAQILQKELEELTKKERMSPNMKEASLETLITSKTWDYNDKYIEFYDRWSKFYKHRLKTSAMQKLATIEYLKGQARRNATGSFATRQAMNIIPPVSRENKTTLHPEIISEYLSNYNEELSQLNQNRKDYLKTWAKENPVLVKKLKERNCE